MPRLKLYITYDGTRYKGWQRQLNTPDTIQEVIETKLSIIANGRVRMRASGRTDAGVHARIQVAHCDVPEHVARLAQAVSGPLQENRLKQSLNTLLPYNIRVLRIDVVPQSFHAARPRKKTYLYFIDPSPVQLPEVRRYAWHLRFPLDWEAIEQATHVLEGHHDFKAFCGKGSAVKTTTRTLFEARWGVTVWQGISHPVELKVLRLTGSGFLKHMVRSIAGTLVHIGNRKASPDLIPRLLETGDRAIVGPTAPAHGLWLWDIQY